MERIKGIFGKTAESHQEPTGQETSRDPIFEKYETIVPELNSAQLRFADTLYRKSGGQTPFSQILDKTSSIMYDLRNELQYAYRNNDSANKIVERVKRDIDKIHARGLVDWSDLIMNLIEQERAKIKLDKDYFADEPGYEQIGPISIKQTRLPDLEKYGIKPEDIVLEMHVDDMFTHPELLLGSKNIKILLKEVADYLRSHPEVRAVVGESWLMSHPISKVVGFTIVPEKETLKNPDAAWSQFITKEGSIKKALLEKTVREGVMPFRVVFGYILADKFIKLHAPVKVFDEHRQDEGNSSPAALSA